MRESEEIEMIERKRQNESSGEKEGDGRERDR